MNTLISGCSYTDSKHWPTILFGKQITNLAKSGMGNTYISGTITSYLDPKNLPDRVFILWSGVERVDTIVPDFISEFIESNTSAGKWKGSGGKHTCRPSHFINAYNDFKAEHWPKIKSLADFLKLPTVIKQECYDRGIFNLFRPNNQLSLNEYYYMKYLDETNTLLSESTFKEMSTCFALLEKYKIPYQFSFIYDFNKDYNSYVLGKAVTTSNYYKQIDWSKFIDCTPYEFGIRHDFLADDGFHLTDDGMNHWAEFIKPKIVI